MSDQPVSAELQTCPCGHDWTEHAERGCTFPRCGCSRPMTATAAHPIRGPLRRLGFALGVVICPHVGHNSLDCPDEPLSYNALREAVDDFWGCIGTAELQELQPETRETARRVHDVLWPHDGEAVR